MCSHAFLLIFVEPFTRVCQNTNKIFQVKPDLIFTSKGISKYWWLRNEFTNMANIPYTKLLELKMQPIRSYIYNVKCMSNSNVVSNHILKHLENNIRKLFSPDFYLMSQQQSRPASPFNEWSLDLEGPVSRSKGSNWGETFKYLKNKITQLNQKF